MLYNQPRKTPSQMPNCFQLLRHDMAVPFVQIDQEMCDHFKVPCHPHQYFRGWYDLIGWDLAMGRSFDEIRETYSKSPWQDSGLLEVAEWLRTNFQPRSWYEPKSRQGA